MGTFIPVVISDSLFHVCCNGIDVGYVLNFSFCEYSECTEIHTRVDADMLDVAAKLWNNKCGHFQAIAAVDVHRNGFLVQVGWGTFLKWLFAWNQDKGGSKYGVKAVRARVVNAHYMHNTSLYVCKYCHLYICVFGTAKNGVRANIEGWFPMMNWCAASQKEVVNVVSLLRKKKYSAKETHEAWVGCHQCDVCVEFGQFNGPMPCQCSWHGTRTKSARKHDLPIASCRHFLVPSGSELRLE